MSYGDGYGSFLVSGQTRPRIRQGSSLSSSRLQRWDVQWDGAVIIIIIYIIISGGGCPCRQVFTVDIAIKMNTPISAALRLWLRPQVAATFVPAVPGLEDPRCQGNSDYTSLEPWRGGYTSEVIVTTSEDMGRPCHQSHHFIAFYSTHSCCP
jgi:hypothetical protein